MWDPRQYLVYADERARPFHELLARVRCADAATAVDLGCGDGALTATLAARWPAASVLGIDSSAEMLSAAGAHAVPGRVRFRWGSIEAWRPEAPVDVLVSNAALQWIPDHAALFDRWVAGLAPGGWFAFQVPGNFEAPSHTVLADLRQSARWRARLGAAADRSAAVLAPADYVERLGGLGCRVDAWETTYLHLLAGPDPVLDWVRGTALRPVLAVLSPAEATEFEAEYGERLRAAYPANEYGTLFPYRRIFVVAQRAG